MRKGLKQMGMEAGKQLLNNEETGVPIEPNEQTALVDATMQVAGCLISGVPGAGGYDAIFCILFGDVESVRERVMNTWQQQFDTFSVCPLLLAEDKETRGVHVHAHE